MPFNLPEEIRRTSRYTVLPDDPSFYEPVIEHVLSTDLDLGLFNIHLSDPFDDDPEIASVLIAGYSVRGNDWIPAGNHPLTRPPDYFDHGYKFKFLASATGSNRGTSGEMPHAGVSVYSNRVRNYWVPEKLC